LRLRFPLSVSEGAHNISVTVNGVIVEETIMEELQMLSERIVFK
jgi:hypothetical protein